MKRQPLSFSIPLLVLLTRFTNTQEVSTSVITEVVSLPPATTVTQTFTAPLGTSTASLSDSYTSPSIFHDTMLNQSNYYRYLHSAPFLEYNTSLATFAQSYSAECIWAHNPRLGSLDFGENLAKGYPNLTAAIAAWYDEVWEFDYDFDTSDPTGYTDATGHFTQLVWIDSVSVGCGWTDCEGKNGVDGVLLVCDYYPAGNVIENDGSKGGKGLFVQNVLPERKAGDQGWASVQADALRGIRNDTSQGQGGSDEGGAGVVVVNGMGVTAVLVGFVSLVAAWGLV